MCLFRFTLEDESWHWPHVFQKGFNSKASRFRGTSGNSCGLCKGCNVSTFTWASSLSTSRLLVVFCATERWRLMSSVQACMLARCLKDLWAQHPYIFQSWWQKKHREISFKSTGAIHYVLVWSKTPFDSGYDMVLSCHIAGALETCIFLAKRQTRQRCNVHEDSKGWIGLFFRPGSAKKNKQIWCRFRFQFNESTDQLYFEELFFKLLIPCHPCMVYLPTFTTKKTPSVGKYTIHGWYG